MKFTNPNLNPNMLLGFKTNFNFNLKFLNPSNILEFTSSDNICFSRRFYEKSVPNWATGFSVMQYQTLCGSATAARKNAQQNNRVRSPNHGLP